MGDYFWRLYMNIRLAGLIPDSITDGPGIHFTVFVQGCGHKCPGCHNSQTHDYAGGYDISLEELFRRIAHTELLSGVTFSGGEPFDKALPLSLLARAIHYRLHLPVMCYTGYTLEELVRKARTHTDVRALLTSIDTLVDGPFILEKKSLDLEWRGSSNQKLYTAKDITTALKA